MNRTLTPKQAADRAGCGRSSIMRALASGELPATRDNRGRWKIDPDALDLWAGQRPVTDRTEASPEAEQARPGPDTAIRLAAAETRAEMLTAQLEELRADRDAWRAQAEKLAASRPSWPFLAQLFRRS